MAAGAATSVSIHAPLARSNDRSAARRSSVFRFQHAPLARSNRRSARSCADLSQFQYMLLLRGATGEFRSSLPRLSCFNTCSSCEEQQENLPTYADLVGFNTCSSCEEQLAIKPDNRGGTSFNTCSSCEVQPGQIAQKERSLCLNTCSSCEVQLKRRLNIHVNIRFQYMLLLRGATKEHKSQHTCKAVSIHAPLARSNSDL